MKSPNFKLLLICTGNLCLQAALYAQNVGIGTTNPDARLHIVSGSSNPLIVETNTPTNWLALYNDGGYKGYLGIYTAENDMDFGTGLGNDNGKVHLVTRALPRLTISAGGNVGIGFQNPLQKLEVNGKLKIGNDATTPTAGTIRFNTTTNDFEGYDGTQWKSLTKPLFSKLIYQPVFRNRSDNSATGYSGMGDIAVNNNFLLIGNRFGHINPTIQRGSVEVYLRSPSTNTYSYQTRFQDVDTEEFTRFGNTINFTANGGIVVSNPTQPGTNGSFNGGRVSMFARNTTLNTFVFETAINGPNGSNLGHSMAIAGDSLLVSLPGANACRLYTLNTGSFNLRFTFNRPAGDNGTYGDAVAVGDGGNVLAIASTQTSAVGRVYIIRRSGAFMNSPVTITAPNNEPSFGKALLYTGNELFVGGTNRVYIYNNNISNTLLQTLTPDNTSGSSEFGAAFAYNPNEEAVYIGDPTDESAAGGIVYKFNKNSIGNYELTERIYDFGGTEAGSKLIFNATSNTLISKGLRCSAATVSTFTDN